MAAEHPSSIEVPEVVVMLISPEFGFRLLGMMTGGTVVFTSLQNTGSWTSVVVRSGELP